MTAGLPGPAPGAPDPWKGLRGVMSGALVLEAITVALALLVVGKFSTGPTGSGVTVVTVLAVLLLLAPATLARRWGLWWVIALQCGVIACGIFSLALGAIGMIFAAIWVAILWMRYDVARRMREGTLRSQQ